MPRRKFMAYHGVFILGAPMTMLDRMRRHKNWLKWSLALVCLAFVIFYIPDFLRGSGADAASGDTIAKVEGHEITMAEAPVVGGAQVIDLMDALRASLEKRGAAPSKRAAAASARAFPTVSSPSESRTTRLPASRAVA